MSCEGTEPHLLVEVTKVMVVGDPSASWIWIGAAGVRWPLHLCHLQPISEVDHPTALKLKGKDTPVST